MPVASRQRERLWYYFPHIAARTSRTREQLGELLGLPGPADPGLHNGWEEKRQKLLGVLQIQAVPGVDDFAAETNHSLMAVVDASARAILTKGLRPHKRGPSPALPSWVSLQPVGTITPRLADVVFIPLLELCGFRRCADAPVVEDQLIAAEEERLAAFEGASRARGGGVSTVGWWYTTNRASVLAMFGRAALVEEALEMASSLAESDEGGDWIKVHSMLYVSKDEPFS
jgi:hypothetical protein